MEGCSLYNAAVVVVCGYVTGWMDGTTQQNKGLGAFRFFFKQLQKLGKSIKRYLRPPLVEIRGERREQRGAGYLMVELWWSLILLINVQGNRKKNENI